MAAACPAVLLCKAQLLHSFWKRTVLRWPCTSIFWQTPMGLACNRMWADMQVLCITGPDFAYPPPQLDGYPPARPVAELSGPPDDLAFPPPDTEIGIFCMADCGCRRAPSCLRHNKEPFAYFFAVSLAWCPFFVSLILPTCTVNEVCIP